MSRRANLIPTIYLRVGLPQDTHTKLTLHLFSELEGRVPLGSYQRFLTELIEGYFKDKRLDLAPFLNCDPGVFVVSGSPLSISVLEKKLGAAA